MLKRTAALVLALGPLLAGPAPAASLQERLGHPASARLLIIHADDLGMSHSVNRATLEALEQGLISSASILVPCPWFPEVVRWARAHPQADLGIHLALTSEWTSFRWRPLSAAASVPSLLDADGYFPLVEMTVGQRARPEEAERELRAQVEAARAAGIAITHLDSHMNSLYQSAGLMEVYRRLARDYKVPLRWDRTMRPPAGAEITPAEVLLDGIVAVNPGVDPKAWRATYEGLLAPLPPGAYMMVLHLAYADEEMWGATGDHPDWGAAWRRYDLDLVRSPEFRRFLKDQGFVIVTWKDLAKAL
ncbi:MAG TPA: polysaccharide deacetylase family protein, partial [Vicinamibacteria bacterium]|nr:polysaccharide deacetylase family protein [Vicinamibacteria bacterium]